MKLMPLIAILSLSLIACEKNEPNPFLNEKDRQEGRTVPANGEVLNSSHRVTQGRFILNSDYHIVVDSYLEGVIYPSEILVAVGISQENKNSASNLQHKVGSSWTDKCSHFTQESMNLISDLYKYNDADGDLRRYYKRRFEESAKKGSFSVGSLKYSVFFEELKDIRAKIDPAVLENFEKFGKIRTMRLSDIADQRPYFEYNEVSLSAQTGKWPSFSLESRKDDDLNIFCDLLEGRLKLASRFEYQKIKIVESVHDLQPISINK